MHTLSYHYGFPDDPLKSSFTVLALNIRSLRTKLRQLTDYIEFEQRPNIIFINETWVSAQETNLFNLPGYLAFHSARVKKGGGVAIFVDKSFSMANEIVSFEHDNSNFLLVDIIEHSFKVATAYRPPSAKASKIDSFFNQLEPILYTNKNLLFFGDINIDYFAKNSRNTKKMIEAFGNNCYKILNSAEPHMFTRKNSNTGSNTCIDILSTNSFLNYEISIYVGDITEIVTDHKAFLISFNSLSPIPNNVKPKRTIYITDHDEIQTQNALKELDESSIANFLTSFSKILKDHTRSLVVKERFKKPFMHVSILNLIKIRDNCFKSHKMDPSDTLSFQKYKAARNKVSALIRRTKKKR